MRRSSPNSAESRISINSLPVGSRRETGVAATSNPQPDPSQPTNEKRISGNDRFATNLASVYHRFTDVDTFVKEINSLLEKDRKGHDTERYVKETAVT